MNDQRPKDQNDATPGATIAGESSVRQASEDSRPRELLPSNHVLYSAAWIAGNPHRAAFELQQLRAALEKVANLNKGYTFVTDNERIAREALRGADETNAINPDPRPYLRCVHIDGYGNQCVHDARYTHEHKFEQR